MDYNKVKDNCIAWIKDWFEHNGPECNAVIGISGGKDSTIVAKLCVEALGADRVIGISIPDTGQDDKEAKYVAEVLGIRLYTFPINNITSAFEDSFWEMVDHNCFDKEGATRKERAEQNLPARVRMCALYYISQTFNGRVANTCNLSEDMIGYSSIWGDSVGDFSPLGFLTVTEVRGVGDALGLPHELVWKIPDDGLPHSSPDEEKFGFTYETLDKYIRDGIEPEADTMEKIDRMVDKSAFKRRAIHLPKFNPFLDNEE